MDNSNYGKKYDLNPSSGDDIDTSRTGAKYDLTGGEFEGEETGQLLLKATERRDRGVETKLKSDFLPHSVSTYGRFLIWIMKIQYSQKRIGASFITEKL